MHGTIVLRFINSIEQDQLDAWIKDQQSKPLLSNFYISEILWHRVGQGLPQNTFFVTVGAN